MAYVDVLSNHYEATAATATAPRVAAPAATASAAASLSAEATARSATPRYIRQPGDRQISGCDPVTTYWVATIPVTARAASMYNVGTLSITGWFPGRITGSDDGGFGGDIHNAARSRSATAPSPQTFVRLLRQRRRRRHLQRRRAHDQQQRPHRKLFLTRRLQWRRSIFNDSTGTLTLTSGSKVTGNGASPRPTSTTSALRTSAATARLASSARDRAVRWLSWVRLPTCRKRVRQVGNLPHSRFAQDDIAFREECLLDLILPLPPPNRRVGACNRRSHVFSYRQQQCIRSTHGRDG